MPKLGWRSKKTNRSTVSVIWKLPFFCLFVCFLLSNYWLGPKLAWNSKKTNRSTVLFWNCFLFCLFVCFHLSNNWSGPKLALNLKKPNVQLVTKSVPPYDFPKSRFNFYNSKELKNLKSRASGMNFVLCRRLRGEISQKKKALFWGGGMFFWDRFVNFCPFDIKKFLARLGDWADLLATYRPISGQFRPQIKIWNFKNMRFLLFLSKFWTFFFQMSES